MGKGVRAAKLFQFVLVVAMVLSTGCGRERCREAVEAAYKNGKADGEAEAITKVHKAGPRRLEPLKSDKDRAYRVVACGLRKGAQLCIVEEHGELIYAQVPSLQSIPRGVCFKLVWDGFNSDRRVGVVTTRCP